MINRKPDLKGILQLIQDEKCTHINAVPTIYGWIVQSANPDAYDLSSLRCISYAGSPFPTQLLKQCIHKFGPKFAQVYAMTECAGGTMLFQEDHVLEGERSRLLASAGKASMSVDVQVVNGDDRPVPVGEVGEIVIRGKCVMMGYWKNPELTASTLRGGWYHTGDMGYIDEEGYLFLVDRKADMIVTGGENVYPKETEDVTLPTPGCCHGRSCFRTRRKMGRTSSSGSSPETDQQATEQELIAHCKEHLAGYKCPKSVEFWSQLPTTPVGKILRKDVKKKFWEGRDRSIG